MSGPPGLHEIIQRGGQVISLGRAGGISIGRHSLPGTGHGGQMVVSMSGGVQGGQANPQIRRPALPAPPAGKLMRLRCRFRPLHDAYVKNGAIVEDDADVIFLCGDGHQLKAHRVIMASSSKFFAKVFEDQRDGIAVVSVPDIKADIMKLILQLTYRDRVILTMRQIKEVGEFITLFGMAWTQFGYEEYNGEEPMTSLPVLPVPMKPVELPKPVVNNFNRLTFPHQQQQGDAQQQDRKVYSGPGARMAVQQNLSNNGNHVEEDDYPQQNGPPGQNQNIRHSRKSQLTPRAGTEGEGIMEQDEEEDPENLIRDWMNKLGKREPTSSSTPPGMSNSVKRMRMDEVKSEQKSRNNSCSVCHQQFKSDMAWRWHEERHVGHKMFKCKFCDELNNAPKTCWVHERDAHGFTGLAFHHEQQQQQKQKQQQPQQSPQRLMARPGNLVGPSKFANQELSKRIKMATMKKVQVAQKKKPMGARVVGSRLSQIGIGDSNGAEQLDLKKLKQLHWLYVCERCDNCADSASKATLHYNRCFPNKEKEFEDTVIKYRQGFYGKSNCPLCPRRYPQNSGFMIHCGHQHQQYRKLFTHIGGADDQLKCNTCKETFAEPVAFHEHLGTDGKDNFFCQAEPKDGSAQETPVVEKKAAPVTRSSTEGKATRPRLPRRPESPMESKSYKVQFHTPPRSARLASRAQAEASAEAAKAKATATDINFPPVDCPVCGDNDLPNISDHLKTKHKDLNVDVTRISSELLRCKGCTITFDVCDLLDHKNCMNPKPEVPAVEEEESNSSSSTSTTSAAPRRSSGTGSGPAAITANAKAAKATAVVVDPDTLPPGVGRSPIEKIEIDDLLSIQAIRSALKCLICGNTAKKLGVIADCLRAHGIHRCSLCFNSYCSKNDYAAHLKKCHGSGSNKLKCPLCPKAFANAGQTSGHMYSTHWLQILKQNEQALNEEEQNGEEEEKEKTKEEVQPNEKVTATEPSEKTDDIKNDEGNDEGNDEDQEEDDDEEDDKSMEDDDDDNQAQVTGIADSEMDEDMDDDDKMEIVEGSLPPEDEISGRRRK